ncbi:MAG: hypothetical protein ABR498_03600, partial [Candidatus Dormibacteria bacterium]
AYEFAGTVTRRRMRIDKDGLAVWRCEAQDYTWLMNRVAKVTAEYRSIGANAVLARVLANFTDGGFGVGYCPASFGDVSINFDNDDVSASIDKLAAQIGAYWLVDAEKRVYMFDTWPDGNTLSVGNSTNIRNVDFDDDLPQLRNRTTVVGGGSTASAVTPSGSATVAVQDTTPFNKGAGGMAIAERNVITYTSTDVATGPGFLTGCTGVTTDIPQGARVLVYRQANDTTAQTAMATTLGGLSGIVAHFIQDDSLTDSEAALLAAEDVASFKDAPSGLQYDVVDRVSLPGKMVAVSITTPITISGSYRIQSVTLTPYAVSGSNMSFSRRVNARVFEQRIAALLRKVA